VPARHLILASQSPARRGLLRAAGIDPEVRVSGIDEDGWDPARPGALVAGLAHRKARAVAAGETGGALVLGCDSVLEVDGRAHGKPADAVEAARRWRHVRGRSGTLHTGHCLIDTSSGATAEGVATTVVTFAAVTDAEVDAYVATGEPLQVAGGFTLDGRSAPFVTGVVGDPSNVIGLSLPLLRDLLGRLGLSVADLWA
jgi:septum formation protein